jgi:two-component sensor histidine kinase/Tfp pilus assembly protein PilF
LKRSLIICLLIILVGSLPANTKIDSLETLLNNVVSKEKPHILNQLSTAYRRIDSEMSMECGFQALKLAEQENNIPEKAYAFSNIGICFRKIGDYNNALEYFHNSLHLFNQLGDKKNIANTLDNIAHIYWFRSEYSFALDHYNQALEINLEINDKQSLGRSYNNLGSVYYRLCYYDLALENFLQALHIKNELNDKNITSTLNNLGNIYLRLLNFEKALSNYKEALCLKKANNDVRAIASTLNNIGNVYLEMGKFELALQYYIEALKYSEENNIKKVTSTSLNNIAVVYENTGKKQNALDYYQQALSLKEDIDDKFGIANTQKNIGDLYVQLKQYEKAKKFLFNSLHIATEIAAKDIIKNDYKYLAKMYAAQNNFPKAYKYENLHSTLKDSIFNESTTEKIAQMQTSFEVAKTKKEREILLKDNEIFKLQVRNAKAIRFRFYLLFLVLVQLILFVYFRYRQKKKTNLALTKINNELEQRVQLRTNELAKTNLGLQNEIKERKKAATELRASLHEKDIMLKEIHHRVKNNLQVVSSMMNLQSDKLTEDYSKKVFINTQDRIHTMSLVHEKLYLSENLASIDFCKYVKDLIDYLFGTYGVKKEKIVLRIKIDNIFLSINSAISCGLIINEITSNSFKYAFPGKRKGEIFIQMQEEGEKFILQAGNNGVPFPHDIDVKKTGTFGLEMIRILTNQLNGKMEFNGSNGAHFKLQFKESNKKENK